MTAHEMYMWFTAIGIAWGVLFSFVFIWEVRFGLERMLRRTRNHLIMSTIKHRSVLPTSKYFG